MPRAKPPAGSRVPHRGGAPALWLPMSAPGRTFAADSGDVPDLMGRAAAGVRNGGCAWANGPLGKCLSFDGSAGYVALPSGLFPGGPVTLSLRVKFNQRSSFRAIFSAYTGDGDSFEVFNQPLSDLVVGNFSEPALIPAAAVVVGPWYHIAAVDDGSTVVAYLDGLRSGTAGTSHFATRTVAAYLGTRGGSFPLDGSIDDVKIYPRALSAAEVARDAADPWWRLRRGTRWAARYVSPVIETGTGSAALGRLAGAGSGLLSIPGTGSAALARLAGAGSGSALFTLTGTGSAALGRLAGAGSGTSAITLTGTGSAALAALVAAGTGLVPLTIRIAIHAALADAPAIAAIVGANVFPLKVPSSRRFPALTVQLRKNPRDYSLDGPTGTARARFGLGCCSRSILDVEALEMALRNLFDGYSGMLGGMVPVEETRLLDVIDSYEPPDPTDPSDAGIFRALAIYEFRYREPAPVR